MQSTESSFIFLGAGASAPFGYPPTKPFVDTLMERIPEHGNEGKLLRSIRETQGVEDAEHITQILDLVETVGASPLKKFLQTTGLNFQRFSNLPYNQFESIALSLRNQLRTEIFRTYSWRPEAHDELDLYTELFSAVGGPTLDVFTTNYDRIVEEYCRAEVAIHLEDGFVFDQKRRSWEWNPDTSYKTPSGNGRRLRLFKLHGSLNWRRTVDDRIEQVGPEEPIHVGGQTAYTENLLIYPGGKGEPTIEPFQSLYKAFDQEIKDSTSCVVVGFSFRDEYLNRGFMEFITRENTRLVVVSPSATKNLEENLLHGIPLPKHGKKRKIVSIDKPFDRQAIEDLVQSFKPFVQGNEEQ